MDKSQIEKNGLYEAKLVGGEGKEQVKIVSIFEKTCTVEVIKTAQIAVAKICDISPCSRGLEA
ncbi:MULTISPECIES: hypothetical protein [Enterococcus]|uniref:Uncharacterized protein n=1 Tax=Enterococcus diestrammenae TaxID=1155073 RepID=A0ABV0F819_9ENTE|nr:hypothetical protein [Enterococcus diestrammenae]KAF1300722.1 hypothetical protein BAU18_14090 [Enterococcus diestrammenae]HIX70501.1 hypothetical protein [Candidatus Enterococcus stercoravium]